MAALFEAYITNLGKYNEGVLAGEPQTFPTSPQEVQALLKDIGVNGIRYEEFFIDCYDFGGILSGLQGSLGEYESLDELNHLAYLLSELSPDDLAKFEAALSMGTHTSNLTDIINLAKNLDCFEFYPDIESKEDLGRYFTEDLEIPAELVVDICAGSGTTVVAAVNTDCRCICFETAPAFFGPATERIEQARAAVAAGGKGV